MNQPLENKIFISTRPAGRSDELTALFEKAGGKLLEMPLIKIQPAQLSEAEKKWLSELENFNWLIFTSPNGIKYFFEKLNEISGNNTLPGSLKIAVIGAKTEKVLNEYNYKADYVNPGNTGDDFASAFGQKLKKEPAQRSVLLALGNKARTVIQNELSKHANCCRIDVYETVEAEKVNRDILQIIQNNRYEMIIFTSPSGVESFMKHKKDIEIEILRAACIGTVTSGAAITAGIKPLVVAENPSAKGIVESIINYYN